MDRWLYTGISLLVGALAAVVAALGVTPGQAFLGALAICGLGWFAVRNGFSQVPESGQPPGIPVPSTRSGDDFAPGFARALIENVPGPVMAVSESGRVTYFNAAAGQEFPQLATVDHFAHVIRAPAFVEAVTETLRDGVARSAKFTSFESREKLFLANVNRSDADEDRGLEIQAVIQLENHTMIERSQRLRSDFIANASHELRTPLASIVGYIETLQNHAKDDPEARERFLGIMARQAERMQRLVEDLMSLGRIEMNQHVKPNEQLSLLPIVSDCASAMLPLAAQEGSTIVVDLDQEAEVRVAGDRDQLSQVFTNLMDNALKYGGSNSTVTITSASATHGGRIGITVADTGPGIPRDKIHRLTERFYRVNVNQSRNRGGTGLGLAIVKHILNRHGGRLEITSEEGQGSRFTVWLPTVGPRESSETGAGTKTG